MFGKSVKKKNVEVLEFQGKIDTLYPHETMHIDEGQ
jgi:hypothetical protein